MLFLPAISITWMPQKLQILLIQRKRYQAGRDKPKCGDKKGLKHSASLTHRRLRENQSRGYQNTGQNSIPEYLVHDASLKYPNAQSSALPLSHLECTNTLNSIHLLQTRVYFAWSEECYDKGVNFLLDFGDDVFEFWSFRIGFTNRCFDDDHWIPKDW